MKKERKSERERERERESESESERRGRDISDCEAKPEHCPERACACALMYVSQAGGTDRHVCVCVPPTAFLVSTFPLKAQLMQLAMSSVLRSVPPCLA